jgi:hypothetical protein
MRKGMIVIGLATVPLALVAPIFTWPYDNPQARAVLGEMREQVEAPIAEPADAGLGEPDSIARVEFRVRVLTNCVTDSTGSLFSEATGEHLIAGRLKDQACGPFLERFQALEGSMITTYPAWSSDRGPLRDWPSGRALVEIRSARWDEGTLRLRIVTADLRQQPPEAGSPPTKELNGAAITAVLPRDETLVVGGLRRKRLQMHLSELPLLSELPGVGSWFTFNTERMVDEELVILITRYTTEKP